jgi:N-acetylmuramic acid 6-phosphate etherase
MDEKVYEQLHLLTTELVNPRTRDLDTLSVREILEVMNREDREVILAVERVLPEIEQAMTLVEEAFRKGGRLFYVGAGTSGRLGLLDAAECPPTFGTDPEMVQGIIAGGYGALVQAVEGAEDRENEGAEELKKRGLNSSDVVIGIAASRRTPFVMGALKYATSAGAATVLLTCNEAPLEAGVASVVIAPVVGPEVIAGSTRLKAGTATKLILNMITTASMVRLGKVWGNLMVDLKATSEKLKARSCRILTLTTGCSFQEAVELLSQAGGELKTAIVMAVGGMDAAKARKQLKENDGSVKGALAGNGQRNR